MTKDYYLLLTIPEKYETVITAIDTDSTNITLEFVKTRRLGDELKLKDSQVEASENRNCAFSISKHTDSQNCFECGVKRFL